MQMHDLLNQILYEHKVLTCICFEINILINIGLERIILYTILS
jgi:hypothetical protein